MKIDGCFSDDEDWDGQSYRNDWPGTFPNPVVDRLLHPSMRKCATVNDPTYVARIRRTRESSRDKITGPYKVRLYPVTDSGGNAMLYETVRPTQQLDISFDGTSFSLLRRIAQSGNDWFIVLPCFTKAGLSMLRADS